MSSAGVVAISPSTLEDSMVFPPPLLSQESIFIFVVTPGTTVPMRVLESESIESVKLRIQKCQGFVRKNQKLICGGRELARSNSLVRDYGVSDGNVLHLVLRVSDILTICVRTSSGKDYTFHADRNKDVGYVKRKLAAETNKNVGLEGEIDYVEDEEDQEVLYDGKKLEDQKLINDICQHNDAVIHLFVRKCAKIWPKPVGKNNFEFSFVAASPELDNKARQFDGNRGGNGYEEEILSETKTHFVPAKKPSNRGIVLKPVIVNPKIELPLAIREMIDSTLAGLESGSDPVRSSEGTGGAYFMQDASKSKYVAVFKPLDEEPLAKNNPRGLPLSVDREGLKKGTVVGEGAFRECAAYILDHPRDGPRSLIGEANGFAGVPPTFLVRCLHRCFNHPDGVKMKAGSLQLFVENDGSCEDRGPNAFPVDEVHKIAVLDMRMANADRHAGNILVGKGEDGRTVLIPIDHGYCLPESFEDCTFDWLYWPQARQPFSPDTLEYIRSVDAEEDIALLKFYGWELSPKSAEVFRISTMLLKKGAERGLTPFAIGNMMCRETLNKPSVIEEIIKEARDLVLPGYDEAEFMEGVAWVMDCVLDKMG
ncbi:OLC1v1038370C1 [Oldenlandia corymbosa var. corymbosa]|uniref:1-phosphatidylinositol 4-kinase n=1 Tax=Oldenlandia corymbosa var. corymbosa TaxID=529605 RepID=A0AAV1D0K7_OLDCO|nr:OLC1v1038370C1 [Oldenlandia corymbosa var. corymbosa]